MLTRFRCVNLIFNYQSGRLSKKMCIFGVQNLLSNKLTRNEAPERGFITIKNN
jgi:hypothetical protein